MQNEHHTSHLAQGFGKNTNGMGIFIVAVVFVAISLFTWWLWNNDHKEVDHYRIQTEQTPRKANQDH